MPTPTITFRVRPDRQEAVREIVNAIKDDPGLAESLLQRIRDRADGGHADDAPPTPPPSPPRWPRSRRCCRRSKTGCPKANPKRGCRG